MSSEKQSELPKWACPNCGDIFRGITQDSVDKKAKDHLDECDSPESSEQRDGAKDDDKYRPTVTPPRHGEAYNMSEHFHSMMTRREEPEATSEVINQALKYGQIKSTHISGRFIFEQVVDGWKWWIIVQMVDEAFVDPDKNHLAVTLYSPESDSHEEVEKYV